MKTILYTTILAGTLAALAWSEETANKTTRRHPGHRMQVQFIADKESYPSGEPVVVTLQIKNIGDSPFMFMRGGRQRGHRDNQFAFSAQQGDSMLADIGNPTHFGGLGSFVSLAPNEAVHIPVDLTSWFNFTKTGRIFIRGSYYMQFVDAEGYSQIWEDFACAEFYITIE